MEDSSQLARIGTAVLTAALHTLIPDHWLPFVLVGRARNWTVAHTALVSGTSALVHAALSVALGLAALGAGNLAAASVGEKLERASHMLLFVGGLGYAAWAWKKGGHFHPGGKRLHALGVGGCDGGEGPTNPEHAHYHADGELIRGGEGLRSLTLALIVGANPCVLFAPLLLETARAGASALAVVTLAYCIPAVALTVALPALGVAGVARLRLPAAARYMEAASGLAVALLGLGFWVAGH